jgi:hypothetical protein
MDEFYNPTPREHKSSPHYKKGELLNKGKEFIVVKSKSGIKEYKEKIESADTSKEYIDLGFDEYKTNDKNVFWYENKKGDRVILNIKTKEKEVFLKD